MEEIIRTLLLGGIDEDTIHRVLDVIEEEYEVVDELYSETIKSARQARRQQDDEARKKLQAKENRIIQKAKKTNNASVLDKLDAVDQERDDLDAAIDKREGLYQRALQRNTDKKVKELKAKMHVK